MDIFHNLVYFICIRVYETDKLKFPFDWVSLCRPEQLQTHIIPLPSIPPSAVTTGVCYYTLLDI